MDENYFLYELSSSKTWSLRNRVTRGKNAHNKFKTANSSILLLLVLVEH